MSSVFSKKKRWVVALLAILGAGGLFWNFNYGPGYYSELNSIRSELEKIPGIEVVSMDWRDDDDFPPFRDLCYISATIDVIGKGEIVFCNLNIDSFREAKFLMLGSVGEHRFRIRGLKYSNSYIMATREWETKLTKFGGAVPDISPEGEFAHLFPNRIPNVQSAIRQFDEIFQTVDSWAQIPSKAQHFKIPNGEEYYFWVVDKDSDSKNDRLWMLAYADLQKAAITPESSTN